MNLSWGLLHAGLQSVLDTALDAVVVMDVGGLIVGWNTHAAEIFGWEPEEALGQRLSDLIVAPEYRAAHENGLSRYLITGEGPVLNRRIEVMAVRRDGGEFAVELSVTASDQFGDPLFVGFLRDISERRAQLERQRRLLQESDHRVKNMLTIVAAIAHQTARNSADLPSFETAFSARLKSLANAHQLLVGSTEGDVALSVLAEQVLGADVRAGRARFGGPELLLRPTQVLGLSMILHELYTNAVKYGALCTDEGHVALDWDRRDGLVELTWQEAGPPCDRSSQGTGFGERMIAMSAKSDLQGTVEREWHPEGLVARLRFPLAD
ncbi:MAG TPA: PAS domain S-box protein [Sphingomicrobium sp.]|jgi:PAS domain S-box-containing protein|nr:PAS domain S-box protein [Sphingomicrobium sp.]